MRNIKLANLRGVANNGVLSLRRETQVAEEYRRAMNFRTPGVMQKVVNLSAATSKRSADKFAVHRSAGSDPR